MPEMVSVHSSMNCREQVTCRHPSPTRPRRQRSRVLLVDYCSGFSVLICCHHMGEEESIDHAGYALAQTGLFLARTIEHKASRRVGRAAGVWRRRDKRWRKNERRPVVRKEERRRVPSKTELQIRDPFRAMCGASSILQMNSGSYRSDVK